MKLYPWSLVLALFLCLTACRENHPTAFPVGEWYARDDQKGLFCRLNFHENGRFDGFVDYQTKRAATFEGAWRFRDSILYYTYAKCEPVMLFKDGEDQDTIVEVADSYYTFRTAKGELHRYDRFRVGQPTPENQPRWREQKGEVNGPNAGGLRQLARRPRWTARVGQFCRDA